MTVLPLVIYPDKRLYQVSSTIEKVDANVQKELLQLEAAMKHYEGYAIAGVQVGIMKRMFTADNQLLIEGMNRYEHDISGLDTSKKTWFFINPEIVDTSSEEVVVQEGCLSLPGISIDAARPMHVTIKSLDFHGNEQIVKASGLLSFCFQHEIDHLDGKLFYDRLSTLKKKMLTKKMEKFIASRQ